MKNLAVLAALAVMALATPSLAFGGRVGHLSNTDHPDVPNCYVFPPGGVNAPNCETVPVEFPSSSRVSSSCDDPALPNWDKYTKSCVA